MNVIDFVQFGGMGVNPRPLRGVRPNSSARDPHKTLAQAFDAGCLLAS